MTAAITCCLPACPNEGIAGALTDGCEALCEEHFLMASPASRRALGRALTRLHRLEQSWGCEETFQRIVTRGRYLQFCALLEAAHDAVDRAWARVKLEASVAERLIDPPSAARGKRAMSADIRVPPPAWRPEAVPDLLGY